jgi:hypothetical protein
MSEELCHLFNLPEGEQMTRSDITRKLIVYIKVNNLEDPVIRRKIIPDARLEAVVGNASERKARAEAKRRKKATVNDEQEVSVTGELTYFNLQINLEHNLKKHRTPGKMFCSQMKQVVEELEYWIFDKPGDPNGKTRLDVIGGPRFRDLCKEMMSLLKSD